MSDYIGMIEKDVFISGTKNKVLKYTSIINNYEKLQKQNKILMDALGMVDAVGMIDPYGKIVKQAIIEARKVMNE